MLDMNKTEVLVSFIGLHDPYPADDEEPGPLLSLFVDAAKRGESFDRAFLLCTGATFLERARDLERETRDEGILTKIVPIDIPVRDVIDYAEIWGLLERSLSDIRSRAEDRGGETSWSFLLDSGTPQMKTSLFLAARSGLFPARLLQGIPARFAGGTYKVREVRLEGFPEARIARIGGAERRSSGSGAPRPPRPISGTRKGDPVGSSPAFIRALERARSAARYDDAVLLLGETGTGKTMIARRIHDESARRNGAFVEVNCSAIAENLAESELFGHVRGAFTGADKSRAGKFRAAHGGTLFLDEIGDLGMDVQAKILKVIEDGIVTPVGSDDGERCDLRLLAATNRDLGSLCKEGRFRRDLYERLKVIVLELPPLRERREDIEKLAEVFLAEWNRHYGESRRLDPAALELMKAYPWPGNVRELRNAIKSAACATNGEIIGIVALPDELRRGGRAMNGSDSPRGEDILLPPYGMNLKARLLQVEWEYVTAALRAAGGNRETAARMLGMTGHAFRKALRERLAAFADEGWEEGI